MEAAIWALIGDGVTFLAGAIVAVSFIIGAWVALLDGLRTDRYSVFKRMEGVMRGLQEREK